MRVCVSSELLVQYFLSESTQFVWQRRPELLEDLELSKEQQQLLAEYIREQATDNH